ncbi:MAG: bifunctional DNA primase/polymerase, partial [Verrucomicrobiota bacterium]
MSGAAYVPPTALDRVAGLLGSDAFLVPCIRGTKVPAVTYTQRPFEATQTPAYRYALASGEFNIAVYLGEMSGGLCALDFDKDEDLTAFLALNPVLAGTLRTRGSRGGMVWVRVAAATAENRSPKSEIRGQNGDGKDGRDGSYGAADYPASCNTAHFEWRANGRLSTIYGRHPKGMDYAVLV